MEATQQEKFHTPRVAALYIGKTRREFDCLVRRKEISPIRIDGRLRFAESELKKFIETNYAADRLRAELRRLGLTLEDLRFSETEEVRRGARIIEAVLNGELRVSNKGMAALIAVINFHFTQEASAVPA